MTDDDIQKKLAKEMTLQWQVNDAWTHSRTAISATASIYTPQTRKTVSAVG